MLNYRRIRRRFRAFWTVIQDQGIRQRPSERQPIDNQAHPTDEGLVN